MERYLLHHLSIAGLKTHVFEDLAITAIHQGSGGLFRIANPLSRGDLMGAADSQSTAASADHVRLAGTEIL